jgi:hypothetical protein
MEKISWIDRVKDGKVLNSLKESGISDIITIRLNGLAIYCVGTAF